MIRLLRDIAARFGREQTGAVLVEMTLVTPFLLLLSAGVFEFSNILLTRLSIEAGVKDAARYLARCAPTLSANCISNAQKLAVTGTIDGSGAARVSGWTTAAIAVVPSSVCTSASANCIAVLDGTGDELYRSNGNYVTVIDVSTSYTYSGTGLWAYLGFGALTLTASHEERAIGS
jgi:Flp pilus assembly protein TadG